MWGQIILDISYHTNYWFGFPESNSDIILNLTHWQYWWWFWFIYFICLYYFIFLRLVRFRLMKFNPKIVTSYRAHGKWGDFIICLLPISWCVNILSNSNFIMRMIEWQTESNLFTVRIRGKQWYWIYKLEIKTLLNINQVPKNIGHNHWIIFNNTNLNLCEEYINLIQLKYNNSWLSNNISKTIKKPNINAENLYINNFSLNSLKFEQTNIKKKFDNFEHSTMIGNTTSNLFFKFSEENLKFVLGEDERDQLNFIKQNFLVKKFVELRYKLPEFWAFIRKFENDEILMETDSHLRDILRYHSKILKKIIAEIKVETKKINLNFINSYSGYSDFYVKNFNKTVSSYFNTNIININSTYWNDSDRYFRTNWFAKFKFLKINFLDNNFFIKINKSNLQPVEKNQPDNIYLVIKQKRYTPIQKLKIFNKNNKTYSFELNDSAFLNLNQAHTLARTKDIGLTTNEDRLEKDKSNAFYFNKQNTKIMYRTRKKKISQFFNLNNRRLLRTRRILVLPSNINITLITNSFDVVHSWYVPGLGVKMDCIPGRSTHHTIHIDHAGFYYGQCAEICGRHHHHMPIRVCALPFEHFLIWWYHYGLPYFNSVNIARKTSVKSGIRQYNW